MISLVVREMGSNPILIIIIIAIKKIPQRTPKLDSTTYIVDDTFITGTSQPILYNSNLIL